MGSKLAIWPPDAAHPNVFEVNGDPARKWVVGRIPQSDLRIEHRFVSSRHALIRFDEESETWQVMDNQSTNGTWRNGVKLEPKQWVNILEGDRFCFGVVGWAFYASYYTSDTLQSKGEAVPVEDKTVSQSTESEPLTIVSPEAEQVQSPWYAEIITTILNGPEGFPSWLWWLILAGLVALYIVIKYGS